MIVNPKFTPAAFADTKHFYTVEASDTAYFDVELESVNSDTASVQITLDPGDPMKVPGADVHVWTLVGGEATPWRPPAAVALRLNETWVSSAVVGPLQVTISAGTPATLTCASATVSNAALRVRITKIRSNDTSASATLTPGTNAQTFRVVGDPNILAPLGTMDGPDVAERSDQKLSGGFGRAMLQGALPPAAFGGPPQVAAAWAPPDSTLAFTFKPGPGDGTATFRAPCVYEKVDLGFQFRAYYDIDPMGTDEPENLDTFTVSVKPLVHRMVLVLDRSGSMSQQLPGAKPADPTKWDATVQAAHAWLDLFSAFRASTAGTPTDHAAGFLTFEHGSCGYGAAAAAAEIRLRDPANPAGPPPPLVTLDKLDLDQLDLGAPQTCTPIGDALAAGLAALKKSFKPLDTCTMVLLTDGHENSGGLTFNLAGNPPAGTSHFGLGSFPAKKLTLFAIGAGAGVDEAALAALPALGTAPGPDPSLPQNPNLSKDMGYYALATSVSALLPYFGQMIGHSVDAQDVLAQINGTEATFPINSNERRLVVVVPWSGGGNVIEIAHRDQGSNDTWQVLPKVLPTVNLVHRKTHGMAVVDLATVVKAQDWRVQRLVGDTPQTLDGVLAMVDLHLRATVSFDKKAYGTGDTIVVTCRLIAGTTPVPGATIDAGPDMPKQGLGTYLSKHAEKYGPIPVTQLAESRLAKAVHSMGKGGDRHMPKAGLFNFFLAEDGLQMLPRGPGIFEDGTDRLFDDGGHSDGAADDGVYANRFVPTTEGTYTFRFRAEGKLPDGSRFRRVITVSTWVGVKADPAKSLVSVTAADRHEGLIGRTIAITPIDEYGGYLGPFHEELVRIDSTAGTFTGPIESRVDGSYARTLEFKRGEAPTVTVEVGGVKVAKLGNLDKVS